MNHKSSIKNHKLTSSNEGLYQKYNPQILKVTQEINRLHSQKAALLHKQKMQNERDRKARTRSLIQLGGLVSVSNLGEYCGIELGKDLQTDETLKENVEMFLGLLMSIAEQLPHPVTPSVRENFIDKGKRALIMHLARDPLKSFE